MYRKSNRYLVLFAVAALVCLTAGIAMAAPVAQSITYQGKLTNAAGNPLTGTYSVTFKLYNVSTGGTALSTDAHSVTAANGLFTTPIAVTDPTLLDGRALWLGIKVGADAEMTPRQELRPVPYALSLRPGAVISGDATTSPSLTLLNSGDTSAALGATASGSGSYAVIGQATGSNGVGVLGWATGGIGTYGIGKYGGAFGTDRGGTGINDQACGVLVETYNDWNPGIKVTTSVSTSPGIDIDTTGHGIDIDTTGNGGIGVHTHTTADNSQGFATNTYGTNSAAFIGSTDGSNSDGISVYTIGTDSNGVSATTSGVSSPGLDVTTNGANSEGMVIHTNGQDSHGIMVNAQKGVGIQTNTYSTNIWYPAVDGRNYGAGPGLYAYSAQNAAVYGEAGSATALAGKFRGNVNILSRATGATVMEFGEGLDYSEGFDVAGNAVVTPGTVLVISDEDPGTLAIAAEPYDRRVAGVVSGANGLGSAVKVGGDRFGTSVALAGRVYCNVDATYGAVRPGSQLTTSPTPGYAMAVQDPSRAQGAILGKAMQGLGQGEKGQILVLVTLQ